MKNIKTRVFCILVGVLQYHLLFGQTASEDKLPYWKEHTQLTSIIELRSAFQFKNSTFQKIELFAKPKLELPFSKKIKFVGSARFYVEALDNLEPKQPNQDAISKASRRLFIGNTGEVQLREFYLDFKIKNKHYLTVGKQQVVWGEADGLKILDVVNPMNLREFLLDDFDHSRIPLWSIKADIKIGKITLKPIWVLDLSYNLIPEFEALFFPEVLFPNLEDTSPLPIVQSKLDKPNHILKDSDFGLKTTTFIKGWEVSFNYLYHYDDLPIINLLPNLETSSPYLGVAPEYKRHHLLGNTFSNSFGKFTLRGEMAFAINKAFQLTSPEMDTKGVATTEQFFGALGLDYYGNSNTQLSMQLFQDILFDNINVVGRSQVETYMSFLASRDMINSTLTPRLAIFQNMKHGDGFARFSIKYMFFNNLYGTLGTDIFYGKTDRIFGQFRNLNRITFNLELGL